MRILNLILITVLDEGLVLFFAIEFIERKHGDIKAREITQQLGFVILILLLMVYVFYNDILRYFFH